jgi:hypothetical protein
MVGYIISKIKKGFKISCQPSLTGPGIYCVQGASISWTINQLIVVQK